jgi:hypothetical protein
MTTWICEVTINGKRMRTRIKAQDRGNAEYFLYAAIARKYPGKNDISHVEINPLHENDIFKSFKEIFGWK